MFFLISLIIKKRQPRRRDVPPGGGGAAALAGAVRRRRPGRPGPPAPGLGLGLGLWIHKPPGVVFRAGGVGVGAAGPPPPVSPKGQAEDFFRVFSPFGVGAGVKKCVGGLTHLHDDPEKVPALNPQLGCCCRPKTVGLLSVTPISTASCFRSALCQQKHCCSREP